MIWLLESRSSRRGFHQLADTMNLWMRIAKPELLALLKRVDGLILGTTRRPRRSCRASAI